MGNLLCCVQVDQSIIAIKERFGKFDEVLEPERLLVISLSACSSWMCDAKLRLRIMYL
ncbi:hypothetical protein CsSME_00004143 [Camellia sinensis var. sinensis]